MGFPLFRFTLSNTTAGSVVISEPGGWEQAVLKLERDEVYHSLVETYDQPLTFYGQDGSENGGLDYIKAVKNSQGPDAQITILVEISDNEGTSYSTAFIGLLDISLAKQIDFYKLECPILRDDFWQKFWNRKGTPVDVSSTTDLDGGTRTVISPFTLNLPCQKIRKRYAGTETPVVLTSTGAEDTIQVDMDIVTISEIDTKFDIGTLIYTGVTNVPKNPIYEITEDGSYTFDIRIELSHFIGAVYLQPGTPFYFLVNGTAFAFTATNYFTGGVASTGYTYSATHSLTVGDTIAFYANFIPYAAGEGALVYGHIGSSTPSAPSGVAEATYATVTADTTYPDTTVEAFKIFDAGQSILTKLTSQNGALTSSFLGPAGCGSYYGLTRGLNVRGYSLSSKPFFMSFEEWWSGVNPLLNLGLGYKSISGTNYIEIEKKEDFYNTTKTLNLDYVNNITESFEPKYIFKSIEVGYERWAAESGSGIDDPQTKQTRRTRFKTIGNEFKAFSKFYGASLGIEQTRRNTKEIGKDWRLDEEVMIIALRKTDTTYPELSTPFTSVSGLLNSTTRYNIRLSSARIFKRWQKFFNGCLKWYATNDDFVFASGEGNFDMSTTLPVSDCEGDGIALSEKQDLDAGAGQDFIFVPMIYEFEHPLTHAEYSLINANRKSAIGISRSASDHVTVFIESLEYHITEGKASFRVMLGQSTPL